MCTVLQYLARSNKKVRMLDLFKTDLFWRSTYVTNNSKGHYGVFMLCLVMTQKINGIKNLRGKQKYSSFE